MADRTFSKAFEINRASPVFNYVEDLTLNGGTGLWRPLRPTDFGSISISGASISVDNGDVVAAIGSGNNTLTQISASASQNIAAIASGNASLSQLATYEAPASKAFTPTFAASLLAKGSAGTLFGINGYSNYTGVQYLHIYDNTAATANLISVLAIDSQDNFSIDFGDKGMTMNSGIFIRNSLTPVTQANGGNDLFLTVYYK